MKLDQDKKLFKQAILATSQALNLREVFVEKDYWIVYALKNLANSTFKDKVIFKGGTSLSKSYKIIERFSEDIDLAIIVDDELQGNKLKNFIRNISKSITTNFKEIENDPNVSKKSRFRKTVHEYQKVLDNSDFGHSHDKLIIEINSFACPNPHALMPIKTYIAEFLENNNQDDLIKKYELEPFMIQVLGLERSFTEKILALVRASHHENPIEQLKNKIRHIYDLNKLLENEIIKEFIESNYFNEIIREVQNDDAKNQEFQGEWAIKPLSQCLLFSEIESTWDKLSSFYLKDFKTLVYGELPDSKLIKNSLKILSDKLSIYDNLV